jgi:hypothetical protein
VDHLFEGGVIMATQREIIQAAVSSLNAAKKAHGEGSVPAIAAQHAFAKLVGKARAEAAILNKVKKNG